jgi:hypothetical protein
MLLSISHGWGSGETVEKSDSLGRVTAETHLLARGWKNRGKNSGKNRVMDRWSDRSMDIGRDREMDNHVL